MLFRLRYPAVDSVFVYCCLERYGNSRLPEGKGDKSRAGKFDTYPIDVFHVHPTKVSTAEGKLYLFVAVDRTSKFAVVDPRWKGRHASATAFLGALVEAVPYRIHTMLTDKGIQFADLPKNRHDQRLASVAILRQALSSARDQPSTHQAQPSLDQQTSRAHE